MKRLFETFPNAKNDGLKLKWSHRTNSRFLLNQAIENPEIQLIEADLIDQNGQAVMAHDQNSVVDLTLTDFLKIVLNSDDKKGIKLDFKSERSVEFSLLLLNKLEKAGKLEKLPILWLNCDVFGSLGHRTPVVSASLFVSLCQKYMPTTPLSLGWTVPIPPDHPEALYSLEMVQEMDELLPNLDVSVTLAIRADYLPRSIENICSLMDRYPDLTITFWNIPTNYVNTILKDYLKVFRAKYSYDRILYDLPFEFE